VIVGRFNLYDYVGNSPLVYTDSSGLIIDTVADAGFILYDLYQLAVGGRKDLATNLAALGADVGGALIPGATGLGLGVRAEKAAEKARKFNAEQDALIQMAKEAKRKGSVSADDAKAFGDLAREANVPFRGPETHPSRNFTDPHVHVGPVDHIPVK
jgi:hypothetical protein